MITTFSTFNKNYISVFAENKSLNKIESNAPLGLALAYALSIGNMILLQKYYNNPTNSHNYQTLVQIEQENVSSVASLNKIENYHKTVQELIRIHTEKHEYKYSIYPYDFPVFLKSYYSNLTPIEKRFLVSYVTGKNPNFSSRVIPITTADNKSTSALLLIAKPYTKDEFKYIINDWKDNYTFQGITNALKKIQSIMDVCGDRYDHLSSSFEDLWKEHKRIVKENAFLKDELERARKTTWN